GAPHLVFDGAGLLESTEYDFKGNLLSSRRRLALAYRETPDWSPVSDLTDPADIESAAAPLLEAETFETRATYDALDRITTRTTPDDSVTVPAYNEAGLLESMAVRLRGDAAP